MVTAAVEEAVAAAAAEADRGVADATNPIYSIHDYNHINSHRIQLKTHLKRV